MKWMRLQCFLALGKWMMQKYVAAFAAFEYKFVAEGYYFCPKSHCIHVLIRIRNKSQIFDLPIQEAVLEKTLIKRMHPWSAYILGIICNQQRNNKLNLPPSINKLNYAQLQPPMLSENILNILVCERQLLVEGVPGLSLQLEGTDKKINVPFNKLVENKFLIACLNPLQALSVGYDASEYAFRKEQRA